MSARFKYLIFDLGKVVLDIDFNRIIESWAGSSNVPRSSLEAWLTIDDAYCLFETGKISSVEYLNHINRRFGLSLTHEQFVEGWNSIFIEPIWPTVELMSDLKNRYHIFAYSNTNTIHQQYFNHHYKDALAHFQKVFASQDIGFRKPDPAGFDFVLREIGAKAQECVFIDDMKINVDFARAIGMAVVHFTNPIVGILDLKMILGQAS